MAAAVYTTARWTVKRGREDEFIEAWQKLAECAMAGAPGLGSLSLLRDKRQANVFVSVAPWRSARAFEAWWDSEAFRSHLAVIRPLLDLFEPETLQSVMEIRSSPRSD